MNELDDLLSDVFTEVARHAPHDPDLAGTVRRRVRRGRVIRGGLVLAATAAVLATALTVFPDGSRTGSPPASEQQRVEVVPACQGTVVREILPDWARAGFSDPEPVMPFVRSRSGNVLAILFANPLRSPPGSDVSNKVLWVWHRLPAATTEIRMSARLNGTGPRVTAGLPAPTGPSAVDLPSPGCWQVTITWPGGSETLELVAHPPG